jgi:hypothetical protein
MKEFWLLCICMIYNILIYFKLYYFICIYIYVQSQEPSVGTNYIAYPASL